MTFASYTLVILASLAPLVASAEDAAPIDKIVYLDQLDLTKTKQDYGDAHINLSAEKNPLTLGGIPFIHSLGTHANGLLVIDLKGPAIAFSATVGVDDDSGDSGSVRFYVLGDGKLLTESGVMRGGQQPKELRANLTGIAQLVLKVDDAGDGFGFDHADWGAAQITFPPASKTLPETVSADLALPELWVFVDQLNLGNIQQDYGTVQVNRSVHGAQLTLNGQTFNHGLGTHANGTIVIGLNGTGASFSTKVGIDDDAGADGSVGFTIIGDGKTLATSGVMHAGDEPKELKVDLTGVKKLILKVDDAGDGFGNDHADWAEPLLTLVPGTKLKPDTLPADQAQ